MVHHNLFFREPRGRRQGLACAGTPQEAETVRRDDDPPRWIADVVRQPLANVKGGLSASSAGKVRDFLDENFSRKLAISEMAAVCGLSSYHFVRAFSRTFGMPPHQYILDLRLDFAERLLAESSLAIADIAHLSGFSSQSHFTTMMKKYRHVTPLRSRSNKLISKTR
ncbi:AraC family transcriptional regulator [Mesorhizobium sp. M8A.F.Ca.ET.207.01.1.1]|nr:AraC family transcriptional regulator [Mesorhizobium sp. M8A.F.Ca.ET.207.01.1.1]